MTRDEAQAALDGVGEAMNGQHDDEQGRLTQLNSHLATVKMIVGHLFDHAENQAAADGEG